jgi:hypothetical protein
VKKRKRIEAALDYLGSALAKAKELSAPSPISDDMKDIVKFITMARDTLNGE